MKRGISAVLACILLLSTAFSFGGCSPKPSKVETLTTKSGALRIGIMSDNQLAPKGGSDVYDTSLQKGLELFKDQKVDMLINVGDYTDLGNKKSYENYRNIFRSVYPEGEEPLQSMIMGNHDYWLAQFFDCWEIPFPGKMRRRFMKYTGETSPWTHKVVNGYHFIGFSPTSGDMGEDAYTKKLDWAKEQIELAVKDDPAKPIFVLTHNNPKDTVYMSAQDGCQNLTDLFKNYPQIVSISGHSHAPALDERSIWQGDFTAINTQCLSYVCFTDYDLVQENRAFIEENPVEMIMEVQKDKITIQRYGAMDGLPQGEPWVLSLPLNKENFAYTNAKREAASAAPVWKDNSPIKLVKEVVENKDGGKEEHPFLNFSAASHPDCVQAYQLEFINEKNERLTFTKGEGEEAVTKGYLVCISDYARKKENRAQTVKIDLNDYVKNGQIPHGSYTVNIYARETFGKLSAGRSASVEL